ncbi:uncharacterized protein BO80DRAFT_231727 [Aspergillus ibericus CBS 121593]|uniref:Uncharacterized protein n=1 Tax=Aspergillus ibericus CBS 121593 TaxID=1448316 RepID=A0A395H8P6_9EURO|nr:hypothetical protein BO80DRAFT_231727 [Aspergillus ibericus CBS 121593]RAL04277.1 hypothetical protein BO80DRAFT_231727 [Aspergillus ibericus CBS 121593]
MEEYPNHWKASLLGEEFWKDAEAYNQPIHDSIEADQSTEAEEDAPLHERFLFNLEHEQNTHAPATESNGPITERPGRRRFSMSDAFTGAPLATARVIELSRRPRSQSRDRLRPFAGGSSTSSSRSSSLIRSALSRMALLLKEDSEAEAEPEPIQLIPADEATPEEPLMEFRGGETWTLLTNDRRLLGIDVFWPQDLDEKDKNANGEESSDKKPKPNLVMLDLEQMSPLSQFRNLRSLKITGMMQSYQKYIWRTAWLNHNLDELELGMALPPRIRKSRTGDWPYIKGGWKLDPAHYAEPVYYGDGSGALDPKLGQAEYLDKMVIEKAKVCAMAIGRTRQKLSIRTLILFGFVVDADPFLHWFDVKRLKCINFKDYCVDAGFWLCQPMKKVKVVFPRQVPEKAVVARRVDWLSELKVIELKGGKKVSEKKYTGPESLM